MTTQRSNDDRFDRALFVALICNATIVEELDREWACRPLAAVADNLGCTPEKVRSWLLTFDASSGDVGVESAETGERTYMWLSPALQPVRALVGADVDPAA
ncbi:MAG: hypothetical protein L0H93_07525, partial [Nocardioides sp.]|nr:hypothetical protein [Nocardioides sp.]